MLIESKVNNSTQRQSFANLLLAATEAEQSYDGVLTMLRYASQGNEQLKVRGTIIGSDGNVTITDTDGNYIRFMFNNVPVPAKRKRG